MDARYSERIEVASRSPNMETCGDASRQEGGRLQMGLRIKRKPYDRIVKFKVRLVSRGFTQRPEIDYTETFAPVTRKELINTVLSIAAVGDLEAENMDVDTAFLYGEVDEEIYKDQPDGFEDETRRKSACYRRHCMDSSKRHGR